MYLCLVFLLVNLLYLYVHFIFPSQMDLLDLIDSVYKGEKGGDVLLVLDRFCKRSFL